jgi:hypothetical protein
MRRRTALSLAAGLAMPAAAQPHGRVVVELFTSQGCSSCPPADALLLELIRSRPDLLPLAFHVTYWDRLGWRDPFGLAEATERQRRYAGTLPRSAYPGTVYTPQAVVQGQIDAIGSDRAALLAAIDAAPRPTVPLALRPGGDGLLVEAGAGNAAGTLLLVGFDPRHETPVARGENRGRRLVEGNIVRSFRAIGGWSGQPLSLTLPRPAGERAALLLQAADGRILGSAAA